METNNKEETKREFSLGNRIFCDGFTGTVRYIGPLVKLGESISIAQSTSQLDQKLENWIGIEWDDNNRGKHNGTINGVSYFDCKEGCGSLVKAEKLSLGVDLIDALKGRYLSTGQEEEDVFLVNPATKEIKKFEMVGMHKIAAKQQNIEKLQDVSLNSCGISHISHKIGELLVNVVNLDLSQNLISNWNEISVLASSLNHLEILNLSRNRIIKQEEKISSDQVFSKLKVLVLNECQVSWSFVETLADVVPNLEEIQLCGNNIKSLHIETPLKGFQNLISFDIENNQIESWKEICKLGHLKKLEKINLTLNSIKEVVFIPDQFLSLKALSISHNKVENWTTVVELNKFSSLNSFRFMNNPLQSQMGPAVARQLIIASIAKLTHLNGSSVRKQERTEAEKIFLKYLVNQANLNPTFVYDKNRQEDLVSLHGQPEISKDKEAQTLADEMISLVISSVLLNSSVSKKIPTSMTVANFKILCQRLFKIDPSNQKLFYKETKSTPFPEVIDDDTRQLSYYGVKSDSEIFVEDSTA